MRFFTLLLLLIASLCLAKDGGRGRGTHGDTSTSSSPTIRAGAGGSTLRGGLGERRPPPPLDPSRTVSEQDCSKPIDPQAGNLRCK